DPHATALAVPPDAAEPGDAPEVLRGREQLPAGGPVGAELPDRARVRARRDHRAALRDHERRDLSLREERELRGAARAVDAKHARAVAGGREQALRSLGEREDQ